jgi:putative ABC transport system substrate-binding protein
MQRRSFLTLLGTSAAAWPLAAGAQRGRVRHIGFLAGGARPVQLSSSLYGGFLRGMRELGYVEGRDFVIDWRFAEGRFELFPGLADELVRSKVDVIVLGTPAAVSAVRQATDTIPIVLGTSTDPVGEGIIASLAHPGSNITGLASSFEDTAPKRLELLLKVAPNLTRIGYVVNPVRQDHLTEFKVAEGAAQLAGVTTLLVTMHTPDDVPIAFATFAMEGVHAVIVPGDAFFLTQRQRIAQFALRYRLATIFSRREYVEAGGLMSYGESLAEFLRRAAFYVDKIFKGAKPADLPVQQPTRFYLTINRKTAEALDLAIPLELLVLSDEIIE